MNIELVEVTEVSKKHDASETDQKVLPEGLRLNSIIETYRPHALDDLSNAALMNRVDTKYICELSTVRKVLEWMVENYTCLQIQGKRIFQYDNHYYDTPKFDLYHQHHNQRLNRFKIRHRHYVDSGISYLEVKYKNNRSRTIKTRIKVDNDPTMLFPQWQTFIHQQGFSQPDVLQVKQNSGYRRIALANEVSGERVTIDLGLYFRSVQQALPVVLDKYVIIEVKQKALNHQSPFMRLLKMYGIRPFSFSKYCVGMALVAPGQLKTNRFKPQLEKISA